MGENQEPGSLVGLIVQLVQALPARPGAGVNSHPEGNQVSEPGPPEIEFTAIRLKIEVPLVDHIEECSDDDGDFYCADKVFGMKVFLEHKYEWRWRRFSKETKGDGPLDGWPEVLCSLLGATGYPSHFFALFSINKWIRSIFQRNVDRVRASNLIGTFLSLLRSSAVESRHKVPGLITWSLWSHSSLLT